MFSELTLDPTYKNHEDEILKKWKIQDTYHKILKMHENDKKRELFRFTDGPPFVSSSNGLHLGHVLVGKTKSAIKFYKMMTGYKILNKLGFDVHGLPSENYVSGLLNLKTKQDIENYGLANFNKCCKEQINKTANSWEPIYDKIGRWCDFNDTYKTMDTPFMESVWWTFKQLWDKNLVYKGVKVMAFSYGCGTSLSNFEAGQSYKVVNTKSVYVYFPLCDEVNTGFAAWTTTLWALIANLALCVNANGEYVKVFDETNHRWCIVLESCVKNLGFDDPLIKPYKKGIDMIGTKYAPIFSHMSHDILSYSFKGYTVIADDYVSLSGDIGTGIVTICPCHGEDDYRVVEHNDVAEHELINNLCQVNDEGNFTNKMGSLSGLHVMDDETTKKIIIKMKKRNLLIKSSMYKHSYPHCYRTGTPLIYKTVSSFFVEVTKIKDRLIEHNKKVNWTPKHIGSGRFEQWLQNTRDWGVSRTRFFGTPIPVWISEDGEEMACIGSIDELREYASLSEDYDLSDIHPEFIWKIEFISKKSGKLMKCVNETFDCWFESGSVPIGQLHYPFNKDTHSTLDDIPSDGYISDFICEGVDQCRGWFYTSMVLMTAIFDKPAFKNVICSGLILAADGKKLSKSLGNFTNPMETLEKYGSDYIRLYMLNSPAIKADTLCFNEDSVYKTKQRIIPWINSVAFFLEHATNFQKKGHVIDVNLYKTTTNTLDKWIISNLGNVLVNVTKFMENYELDSAINMLVDFIDNLTNWYIKINRDRLKDNADIIDWNTSLSTLYFVQLNYCLMMAPFMPFLTEHLFKKLQTYESEIDSIFVCEYPKVENFKIDDVIDRRMSRFQELVITVRQMRQESAAFSSIKKPLKRIMLTSINGELLDDIKETEKYLTDEVNSLSIEYKLLENAEDENNFCDYVIDPIQKVLGKKYRKEAKNTIEKIKLISHDEIKISFKNGSNLFCGEIELINGEDFNIIIVQKDNSEENILTKAKETYIVQIDTTNDEATQNAYLLRMFVTKIQNVRKESGLHPWDPINVHFNCDKENINTLLTENIDHVKNKLKCDVTHTKIMNSLQKVCIDKNINIEYQIERLS